MESGQPKSVDPRMHSAEHILSGTMVRLYGCGRPFTTHLEKKKSKVDIQFPRPLTQEELSDLERRVNEVIALDLPVWEELLDRPEAARRFDLARLPDSAGETVRIVHIGGSTPARAAVPTWGTPPRSAYSGWCLPHMKRVPCASGSSSPLRPKASSLTFGRRRRNTFLLRPYHGQELTACRPP